LADMDEHDSLHAIAGRAGRICLLLSLEGSPPCAALKAGILDRITNDELERINEVKLHAYDNREHRAFIRANVVTGFPAVQLYENGRRIWASAWSFEEAALDEMLARFKEPARQRALPAPLETPKAMARRQE